MCRLALGCVLGSTHVDEAIFKRVTAGGGGRFVVVVPAVIDDYCEFNVKVFETTTTPLGRLAIERARFYAL